jgi:hypothetical protein
LISRKVQIDYIAADGVSAGASLNSVLVKAASHYQDTPACTIVCNLQSRDDVSQRESWSGQAIEVQCHGEQLVDGGITWLCLCGILYKFDFDGRPYYYLGMDVSTEGAVRD